MALPVFRKISLRSKMCPAEFALILSYPEMNIMNVFDHVCALPKTKPANGTLVAAGGIHDMRCGYRTLPNRILASNIAIVMLWEVMAIVEAVQKE